MPESDARSATHTHTHTHLLVTRPVQREEALLALAAARHGRALRAGHALGRLPAGVTLGDPRLARAVLRVETFGAVAEPALGRGALGVGHALTESRARAFGRNGFLASVADADELRPALARAQHAVAESVLCAGLRGGAVLPGAFHWCACALKAERERGGMGGRRKIEIRMSRLQGF